MTSTFMGLETSKRGLNTAQSALYTTGHNVANANTPGYSRQRVNLNPTDGFPSPGLNSPMIPGQLGTGVEAGSIQRVRDSFLDAQYRTQNSKIGYYGSLSESLMKMEEVMNDPTENGLLQTMNKFWNALEDLTVNTDNAGARAVVASTGQAVAETLNYNYNSLTNVQNDIRYQIGVKESEINTIISNISRLNESISKVEPNGMVPNDLYDQRDVLVDQLSKLVNVKATAVLPTNYGIANKAVAEGLYNIELVKKDGSSYVPPINLISVDSTGTMVTAQVPGTNQAVKVVPDTGIITGVQIGNQVLNQYEFGGELAGLIESYGYDAGAGTTGKYPDMLKKLNDMTEAFVNKFNQVHKNGKTLENPPQAGGNFFIFDTYPPTNAAKEIKVNPNIIGDVSKIAAGLTGAAGDNQNAHELALIKSLDFNAYGIALPAGSNLSGSFDTYYAGIIGNLGVESASVQKDNTNAQTLAASVDKNRQSVSAVSLDEEMTEMVKFQQAYNASAKMITIMDGMLDKLINGMGIGR